MIPIYSKNSGFFLLRRGLRRTWRDACGALLHRPCTSTHSNFVFHAAGGMKRRTEPRLAVALFEGSFTPSLPER